MKICLKKSIGTHKRGALIDIDRKEAEALIAHGAATAVTRQRRDEKSFGRFLLNVQQGNTATLAADFGSIEVKSLDQINKKAGMTELSGTVGGYLVPTEHADQIYSQAWTGIARTRALVLPMESRSLQIPVLDVTTAPTAGNTAFAGGVVMKWLDTESNGVPETEPQFRQTELIAHELCGYAKLSRALVQDGAIALEVFLHKLFADAINRGEDAAFLLGNGVGQPLGALNSPAAISVTRQTGGTFTIQDAATMVSKLLPGWETRLESICWVVHPTVYAKSFQIASTAGDVDGLTLIDGRVHLLGIPMRSSEAMSALGTSKDVALCDWSYYAIGDRDLLDIAYSDQAPEVANTNQALWRFITRVDGQPLLNGPITLSDATTQVSPFVYLT